MDDRCCDRVLTICAPTINYNQLRPSASAGHHLQSRNDSGMLQVVAANAASVGDALLGVPLLCSSGVLIMSAVR